VSNDPVNAYQAGVLASNPASSRARQQSFIGSNFGAGYSSSGGVFPRGIYLQSLTKHWATAIPMSTQWVVLIDSFPVNLTTQVLQGLERTDGDKAGFDIDQAVNTLTNYDNQQLVGCIFSHEVTIPSEQFNVESIAIANNRGFLPGVLGSNRSVDAPSLNITFKETDTSFTDYVLRPWVILGAHYGMVARPEGDTRNIKATIRVLEYTRTGANISMVPRKSWVFYNCVPYNVSEHTLEYETEKLQTFRTLWTYSNYTVDTPLALNTILNQIGEPNY
jgi:hypothetical protein